jgi:GNAT superfamily N-acetyltransferase
VGPGGVWTTSSQYRLVRITASVRTMAEPLLRPATDADAEALGRGVVEGIDGYREFAPPGWAPPPLADAIEHALELLHEPGACCIVAELDGRVIGQITVLPAERTRVPPEETGLGHLSFLMVDREHWGGGVARTLHAAALADARERGYAELRLFAAAGQARARRFYEREGWVQRGEAAFDPIPGLVMTEYRLRLGRSA